ncbi:DUF885 domain-containing protein [Aestuariivivens sediminis]|uniref:DUF885 domain-containing protein n=1 Tax=Aestuariivivens sediminis TaxID=2913557 RepID=UPI001F5772C2|nr:DUF885 domain-containing protein [Aestuariivivens sediminis]
MKYFILLIGCITVMSCVDNTKTNKSYPSIAKLADSYYERTLETFPENAYEADIKLENHNGITSNQLADLAIWENYEDSLYVELLKLKDRQIPKKKDKITYWLLKEELESSIELRVCKRNLWDVNHLSGWKSRWISLAEYQPIGSEELRVQAFERWSKFPIFVTTEINNLKKGLAEGYSMPKEIVDLVIEQLQVLHDYSIENSPFMSPAKRDDNPKFKEKWEELVINKILPALSEYQQYLVLEYRPKARDEVSVVALPNGSECYQAFIRSMTTTNKSAEELFELGQKIVSANETKVSEIGFEVYKERDFAKIIDLINNDPSDKFITSEDILEVNSKLLEKAKKESEKWFIMLPSTEVTIKPYEAHESGIGSYEPAMGDNPAYYRINLNNLEQQKRSFNEILTFHEAYPGHHLQIGLEKDIKGLHSISKLIYFGSYVEGWGRYSEQLAEEMGLYDSKLALMIRRAWPSRGLVVDPAIHTKGWSKEQAIDFMTESGYSADIALSAYYRSIVWPAQLTSYDTGGEEIKALRKMAEEKLGDQFDIKEFHSKILENGSIPLSSLRHNINEWVRNKKN